MNRITGPLSCAVQNKLVGEIGITPVRPSKGRRGMSDPVITMMLVGSRLDDVERLAERITDLSIAIGKTELGGAPGIQARAIAERLRRAADRFDKLAPLREQQDEKAA